MKSIMFVIGILSNGGAERVISILARELCELGCQVSIVTIYDKKNDYVHDERIQLHSIKHKYKNKIIRGLMIISQLRELIRKQNPDIVISFMSEINIYTILSCTLLKNKVIVSERNDPYHSPESNLFRKLRDLLYPYSEGFVFQTNDAKNFFSNNIQQRSDVIPNPIISNLPYWKENNMNKTIVTACRLSKQKNLPLMINAFVKIIDNFPDYKLKIYGEGVLRKELEELVEQLGLKEKVFLPGFSNDIHNEMANSDLFVISSDYEGISNSMLEALAIGVPVISTNSPIGGAKMFIKNDINGLLINVGDVQGLSESMRKILSDKSYALGLSNEAKKIRNELTAKKIAERWIHYAERVYKD